MCWRLRRQTSSNASPMRVRSSVCSQTKQGTVAAALAIGAYLLLASDSFADDWPQWRGLQRNGSSAEAGWLDHWTGGGPPIAWQAKVGLGFSSFVVADGRAFTLG